MLDSGFLTRLSRNFRRHEDPELMAAAAARKVLIVDDEPAIADTLATILAAKGYITTTAYDPREALQLASSFLPDLLISDVMMPCMNGVELGIRIKRELPNCQVLLFSGVASSFGLLQEAREQGYDFQFLHKPVHPKELLRLIG